MTLNSDLLRLCRRNMTSGVLLVLNNRLVAYTLTHMKQTSNLEMVTLDIRNVDVSAHALALFESVDMLAGTSATLIHHAYGGNLQNLSACMR